MRLQQACLWKWPVKKQHRTLIYAKLMAKYDVTLYLKPVNRSTCLFFLALWGLPPRFLIYLWSPAFINMSHSPTNDSLPVTLQSLLLISPLLCCKTSKYYFPETLFREELLSVLFICNLAAIHSSFYVKRGGQLHGDVRWFIVWFSVSFCSAPIIILCHFFLL